jgi:hypothetical protein
LHFQLAQLPPQLLDILHLDGMHAQLPRAIEVQSAIIDEAAVLR